MHPFNVLADPVRRRILELLTEGERTSGDITAVIREQFGLSQPGVSLQLKVLRDNGFATVRAAGTHRIYAIDATAMREVDAWLERFRAFWAPKLESLATEIARGKRERRLRTPATRLPADDINSAEQPAPTRQRR